MLSQQKWPECVQQQIQMVKKTIKIQKPQLRQLVWSDIKPLHQKNHKLHANTLNISSNWEQNKPAKMNTLSKCFLHFLTTMQLLSQKSQLANRPHLHVTLCSWSQFISWSPQTASGAFAQALHLLSCSLLLLLPAGGDRADSGSGQELWAGLDWGALGLLAASCRGRAAGRYSHPGDMRSKTRV